MTTTEVDSVHHLHYIVCAVHHKFISPMKMLDFFLITHGKIIHFYSWTKIKKQN